MTGHPRRCIALLGAAGTGKTQLAQALADSLRGADQKVVVVSGPLAEEQARRTLAAWADLAVDTVITDTPPLQAAICHELQGGSPPLYRMALQHHRCYTHTLLAGLDLPGPASRQPVDARVRAVLGDAGIVFQVVYGQGEQRLRNALSALAAAPPAGQSPRAVAASRWAWACDKCSDPDCEHRLFTGLTGLARS